MVRTLQSLQQVAPPFGRQLGLKEPLEGRVFKPVQVLEILQRILQQPVAVQQRGIQLRGQVGPRIERLPLMIELQVERALQEVERFLGMLRIGQQRLAILDLQHARRVVVTLDPGLQQLLDPVVLLEVLKVEAVEVVEILRAGNQLLEASVRSGAKAKSST